MRSKTFSIVVEAREWVLEYTNGRLTNTLEAGRFPKRRRAHYLPVDKAERLTSLATQEVPTADGVQLKASAAVRWRVVDPVQFAETAADPEALVYLAAQVALRVVLSELPIDGVQAALRSESLSARLLELTAADVAGLGVEIGSVAVKDLVLPAELREASLQLASARTRGMAQLEAARSETAALRSLANAAKLLDEHPSLAKLRLVQSLPMGSSLQLTMDQPG